MSRYPIETLLYIVIFQCSEVINYQPPPLLVNSFHGCCACSFGYIFWRCLVIVVNASAYIPNPVNILNIPMITKNKIE